MQSTFGINEEKAIFSVLKNLELRELCLLKAQLERLVVIWEHEGKPNNLETKLFFKRSGTRLSSPELNESTILTLEGLGLYDIQLKEKQSFIIEIQHKILFWLLWKVNGHIRKVSKRNTISFYPWARLHNYDGSINKEKSTSVYTIKSKKTGQSTVFFNSQLHAQVARILHEDYLLGEVVPYDVMSEKMDEIQVIPRHLWGKDVKEISKNHPLLLQFNWSKNNTATKKREAVRQAGIYLQQIATKRLKVENYIITYNTGLIRIA